MIGGIELFVCIDCGKTFEEPKYWEETHGLDHGPYERWSGCPHCYGAYVETYQCDCCGEWITDTYIIINKDRYCQDCYRTVELGEEF